MFKDLLKKIKIPTISILTVILFFGFLRFGLAKEIVIVSGESMYPTLSDGQIIFTKLIGKSGVFSGTVLETNSLVRDDIIIAKNAGDTRGKIVKRIIGLPGDTVLFDEYGYIYVNGQKMDVVIGKENIPNKKEFVLDSNEFFLLGDNVNNSIDSRVFGPVLGQDVIAVVR